MRLVTRPLRDFTDDNVDLNDIAGNDGVLFVRDGVGFAGRGVAARIPLAKARGFFDEVAYDDTVATLGSDGVLLGWHSFDGGSGEEIGRAHV